ncbi:Recombination protein RecR [BD1-7 clade bacterium]|uniref:Recombination protein RecR n=1 Tax=BD1-7 clade bacterium TaxID=2029982 RepID=A0A5S9QRA1_9GAMM|nr:Recombination protein RecR [BD1-7 clade bacterium]
MFSPSIQQLIDHLQCLPGVGRKSAQRMAMHLLEREREAGIALAASLQQAMTKVGQCQCCQNFTEDDLCRICADLRRSDDQICVVEGPSDVLAVEQSGVYQGRYFVLMGHLSPIDGIGPSQLGIDKLERLVESGVSEVILATNPTVEGEATARFISEKLERFNVGVSRIAHGVPIGGELEYVDGGTLAHALNSRKSL